MIFGWSHRVEASTLLLLVSVPLGLHTCLDVPHLRVCFVQVPPAYRSAFRDELMHSFASVGLVMEGTRLTIVQHDPDGFEFTIRTPGTPKRWAQYDEELSAIWRQLEAKGAQLRRSHGQRAAAATAAGADGGEGEVRLSPDELRSTADLILSVFFYWVNFGPLSRGSAACG